MTNNTKTEILEKVKENFAEDFIFNTVEKLNKSRYWVDSVKNYISKVAFEADIEITISDVNEIYNLFVA